MFGGADTQAHATELKSQLIVTGKVTTAVMNPPKCRGPAQSLTILGLHYDALRRHVNLPADKQAKYLGKLRETMQALFVLSKDLEKLVGYLVWASYAEPFGRPFISALSTEIDHGNPRTVIC